MKHIRTLAPTIFDALNAVEQGCRNIQHDPQFRCKMSTWLSIVGELCFGCLATTTLMKLTNIKAKDIIDRLSNSPIIDDTTIDESRSVLFGIYEQAEGMYTDFSLFEVAIDSLRYNDLWPLLFFYNLQNHSNAKEAKKWLYECQQNEIDYETSKYDLEAYADFLRDDFIPKMKSLFAEPV